MHGYAWGGLSRPRVARRRRHRSHESASSGGEDHLGTVQDRVTRDRSAVVGGECSRLYVLYRRNRRYGALTLGRAQPRVHDVWSHVAYTPNDRVFWRDRDLRVDGYEIPLTSGSGGSHPAGGPRPRRALAGVRLLPGSRRSAGRGRVTGAYDSRASDQDEPPCHSSTRAWKALGSVTAACAHGNCRQCRERPTVSVQLSVRC